MVTITASYQGELRCEAVHGPSGNTLQTDAPKDNQGKGEAFSPTDLVATALVTCILTTMGIVARKLNVDITGAHGSTSKVMAAAPTRRIGSLNTTITMPNQNYTEEQKTALIHAAQHCPVHKSLPPDIDAQINFVWN